MRRERLRRIVSTIMGFTSLACAAALSVYGAVFAHQELRNTLVTITFALIALCFVVITIWTLRSWPVSQPTGEME